MIGPEHEGDGTALVAAAILVFLVIAVLGLYTGAVHAGAIRLW